MFFTLNKAIHHAIQLNLFETWQSMPSAWMRFCHRVRWLLQWGFLGFAGVFSLRPLPVLAQSGVPFPVGAAGTGTDGMAGDATLESQAWISEVAGTFDTLWDTYLSLDSPYFAILLQATTYIVAVGFMLWAIAAVYKWQTSSYKQFPWQMIYTPLLVVFLFANGGQLTLLGLQAYKNLVYGANDYMLTQTYNGVSGRDLIKNANLQQGLNNTYQQKRESCFALNGQEATQCLEEVEAEMQAAAEKLGEQSSSGWTFNPVGRMFNDFMQLVVTGFLSFMAGTFHLIMAYALAVWASSAPIWIAIALYPAAKSSLQIFVSGLFAAMLSIWMFTILQIALASQQSAALGIHGLLYPFLGGFINPFLALFAGSMGFSAVFAASGVAMNTGVKLLRLRKGL
ncbi:hypothetical protein [[Limnothrix rosea] IAM M-220]|uniref:hypothetical protein n=1 Tax=[Limnothrix rosea] IAM M-220 TaxID=454133 RepID=UPI00095C1DE9|nr:hypothetical protein [[Limnothrix rosea] IAM M-220]OKH17667.1 hypothetical protein NIES208_08410 [[Limnothrix rosea] IAM M-220]